MNVLGACGLLAALTAAAPAFAQDDVAPTPEDNTHDISSASRGVRAIVDKIENDLDDWDVQGARSGLTELQTAMRGSPNQEGLQLMEAKIDFYEGRYAEAVELYKRAGSESHPGGYHKLAEDALAQTRDDQHQSSEHFDLYYPPGKDEILAPYALETLESAYQALSKDFGYTPPGRIRVEILPDDEALSRLSTLTIEQIRTTGTIAICKFNRLMIISPRALIRGYDWRDTLNHEFVHFVVSMKSRNTVPIWLHEGLAKYEETRWRGEGGQASTPTSEFLLGKAVKANKLVTFEQMHPSMALLPSAEEAATAFAEVFHAIEFLKARGGTASWNAIIDNLKSGQKYEDAVAHAYGKPFAAFVADWKGYLASRKYPQDAAPEDKLQFKNGAQKKKDAVDSTELVDFQDVKDPDARKLAHLGGLLHQRRHLTAAIEEYGKAYSRNGPTSLQLSSKYGEALLAANQTDEAKKILAAAEKQHPGYELVELYYGQALLKGGDEAAARAAFERGMNTDPFDPRLHRGLLEVFTRLHDAAGVERANKALAILEPADRAAPGAPGGGPTAAASVMLATHPFASVSVDGKPLGRTTPTVVELPAGKHHLSLSNDERGLKKELDLELKPGEQRELRLDLAEGASSAAEPEPTR